MSPPADNLVILQKQSRDAHSESDILLQTSASRRARKQQSRSHGCAEVVASRIQQAVVRRLSLRDSPQSCENFDPLPKGSPRMLNTPSEDCAVAFYMRYYPPDGTKSPFVPFLLENYQDVGILRDTVTAMGMMALANANHSSAGKAQAYNLYGKVLQNLRTSAVSPDGTISSISMATVMMLGNFESIASAEPKEALKAYVMASIFYMRKCTTDQFINELRPVLFLHLRRLIVLMYLQQEDSLVSSFRKWLQQEKFQKVKGLQSLCLFTDILERLVSCRGSIKTDYSSGKVSTTTRLYLLDKKLQAWKHSLPAYSYYDTYMCSDTCPSDSHNYPSQHDLYPRATTEAMWGNFRLLRILLHLLLIESVTQVGMGSHTHLVGRSTKTIMELADEICSAVPIGLIPKQGHVPDGPLKEDDCDPLPKGGYGFLLPWPLYITGSLITTTLEHRDWIIGVLNNLGGIMGMETVLRFAQDLQDMPVIEEADVLAGCSPFRI